MRGQDRKLLASVCIFIQQRTDLVDITFNRDLGVKAEGCSSNGARDLLENKNREQFYEG